MSRKKRVVLITLYAGLLLGGWLLSDTVAALAERLDPGSAPRMLAMVAAVTVLYALTTAIPFVPGAEIGFLLLMVVGTRAAPLIYVATICALVLGFLAGRLVPLGVFARAWAALGFAGTAATIRSMQDLAPQACLELLVSRAPRRWVPVLLRHRYLAAMVLFNLPGNTVIGGGGGIAFLCGLSRIFDFRLYLAAVTVAVAPVPLIFMLIGYPGWWAGG